MQFNHGLLLPMQFNLAFFSVIRQDCYSQFQFHSAAKELNLTRTPFTYRRSPRLNKGQIPERFGTGVPYKNIRFNQTFKPRNLFS